MSTSMDSTPATPTRTDSGPIWWSNATFFTSIHILAVYGIYTTFATVPRATLWLCLACWQVAMYGITIGYHRLWSHRAFTARQPLRFVLALMGTLGFQGSIKWWCARHRLHHRFTDDPINDPYAATKGLFFSHMGWIFRRPTYRRLDLVDKSDLDGDPVVRFQHKYYVPLALGLGLFLPAVIGSFWGDAWGGFIWGGVVSRLIIWHTTFMINSLAHWDGLQPYSDEVTARGNLLLALFTNGEGNHNYHTFPHDFRNGPSPYDWDPSKWFIYLLYTYTPFVTSIKRAREQDVNNSLEYMKAKVSGKGTDSGYSSFNEEPGEIWGIEEVERYVREKGRACTLVAIDGWVVDVTGYMKQHPGGANILKQFSLQLSPSLPPSTQPSTLPPTITKKDDSPKDANWAFNGGMNNHTRNAQVRMKEMRVARFRAQLRRV